MEYSYYDEFEEGYTWETWYAESYVYSSGGSSSGGSGDSGSGDSGSGDSGSGYDYGDSSDGGDSGYGGESTEPPYDCSDPDISYYEWYLFCDCHFLCEESGTMLSLGLLTTFALGHAFF